MAAPGDKSQSPVEWGLEQFCVAVTSILLGGVMLKAFDVRWADRPMAEVGFLVFFLGLVVVNQVGYLQSVKRAPYRWPWLRPLLDVAMVFCYNETVNEWTGRDPAWAWLVLLLVLFVAWDVAKLVERNAAGAYREEGAFDPLLLRPDLRRTWITVFVAASAQLAWAPMAWPPFARELFLLGLLALFWVLKGTPLLDLGGPRPPRARRHRHGRLPAPPALNARPAHRPP